MKDSARQQRHRVFVGTCGFSYRDWVGPFYPLGMKAPDMLGFYARTFGAVEIDSTYYAIPKPALFESMDRRTPDDFRFTVKAPGSITHAPEALDTEAFDSMFDSDASAFRECLKPLVASGKLGAVLLQFPHAFRPGREAAGRLEAMRERWPDMPLVAEFRHRDWQSGEAIEFLRRMRIGWCNVDEPRFATLMRPSAEAISRVGYFRFHGRNAAQWWAQDREPGARYDYLYSTDELVDWLPRIADVESVAQETYVFFNNHRLGKAARNALEISEMLGMGKRAPVAGSGQPPENAERELRLF